MILDDCFFSSLISRSSGYQNIQALNRKFKQAKRDMLLGLDENGIHFEPVLAYIQTVGSTPNKATGIGIKPIVDSYGMLNKQLYYSNSIKQ